MQLGNILTGIQILQKYYDNPNRYHMCAEHDEIYLTATNKPLAQSDLQLMLELGWFQEDGTQEDDPENYCVDEPWKAFV
jgi:hypothetical protein